MKKIRTGKRNGNFNIVRITIFLIIFCVAVLQQVSYGSPDTSQRLQNPLQEEKLKKR